MPFVANTPESLIARSDSRNPTTTCRGITANGRPCRRAVTPSAPPNGGLLPRRKAPISEYDPSDPSLYCFQHKEQASRSARSSPGPRATATPILEERTSIDTLADRLGLVELERRKKRKDGNGLQTSTAHASSSRPAKLKTRKETKQLQFCWCFTIPIEEINEHESPPARPQPRPIQNDGAGVAPVSRPPKAASQPNRLSPSPSRPPPSYSSPGPSPGRASRKLSTASQTARFLSLIPPTTNPQTASALMAELARPYVDSEEPGYIYMFWMTPETATAPVEAARSLLAPPSPARPDRSRRPSDVVSAFAQQQNTSPGGKNNHKKKTMLLKIGRAANVQRRMNEWQRQCGYDVEVIRFYPYIPGASEASGMTPRMTPHCKRVERLVHIELAGLGLRAELNTCAACGKDHREWFEIGASRDGIRAVDEVIRRWVEWDESNPP